MMKNIYKNKFLLLLTVIIFGSCAINDDEPVQGIDLSEITTSVANRVERISTADTSFDVVVSFYNKATSPQLVNVSQRARVTYTLDGVEATIDANAGSNSVTIPVDMSASTFRTVEVTKFQMLFSDTEHVVTDVSSSNKTTVVKGDDVVIQMTWNNTKDIDLLLTDSPAPTAPYLLSAATAIDASLSVGPLETVILPFASPAGDYSVSIVPYAGFTSPIEFSLDVFAGSQAYSFTGTVNQGNAATGFFSITYQTVVEFVTISKTGAGATATYTVTNQL